MKSPTRLIIAALWALSLALAFYFGRNHSAPASHSSSDGPLLIRDSNQSRASALDAGPSASGLPAAGQAGILVDFIQDEDSPINLSNALARVQSLSPAQTRELLDVAFALPRSAPNRAEMITALLTQLAATAPLEALQMADNIGSLRDKEDSRIAILEVWGKNDSAAALNWAQRALVNEPSNFANLQMRAILRGFAEINPKAAFQYVNALDESSASARRDKTRLMAEVIRTQVQEGGLNEARFTVESLPEGSLKEAMLQEMINEWATFDPESAASYIDLLGPEAAPNLRRTLVREWARNDPASAAAWLSALPADDPTLPSATADVIREWTRYDLSAPAEWLNSLPASPELDRAVASYTFRAAQEDPEGAMSWAESIANDRMRTVMMQRVASTWKAEDQESFARYLNSAALSEEQRESLQNVDESRGGWGNWRNRR